MKIQKNKIYPLKYSMDKKIILTSESNLDDYDDKNNHY